MSKDVPFMGDLIKIKQLSVAEVLLVQEAAEAGASLKEDVQGISVLVKIIRMALVEETDLTDEEFRGFPIKELTQLYDEIASFSGMSTAQGK